MVIMQDEGQQRVEIVNDQSGERYGVTVDAYRELYERRGFRIDRFADGRPYADADVDEAADAAGAGEVVPVAGGAEASSEAPTEAPVEAAPAAPTEAAPDAVA